VRVAVILPCCSYKITTNSLAQKVGGFAKRGETVMQQTLGEIINSLREQSTASNLMAQNLEKVAQMPEKTSMSNGNLASSTQLLERLAGSLHISVNRFRC